MAEKKHNDIKNEKYEQFKADILKWKNEHSQEYNRFARAMRSGEAKHYMRLYKTLTAKTPAFAKKWERRFEEESPECIDDFTILVKGSSFPAELVSMFDFQREEHATVDKQSLYDRFLKIFGINRTPKIRMSAPLLLSWLYYGKSFEAMADMMESLIGIKKAHVIEKDKCSLLTKRLISTSIKYGYRTEEDWDRYFESKRAMVTGEVGKWALNEFKKESKSEPSVAKTSPKDETILMQSNHTVPVETVRSIIAEYQSHTSGRRKAEEKTLVEYLKSPYPEEILRVLRNFVINHNTGIGIALTFYALQQLELFNGAIQSKEFSIALTKQFSDIPNLIKPNSIRQAISELRKPQPFVVINGKNQPGTLLQSDEWSPVIESLKRDLIAINPFME